MPYDKRKLKRIDIFLIVEFKALKKAAAHAVGITKDLSCEGFSIESQSFDFGHGEILEFILKHPVGDMSVTIPGEVVWKKQSWYKYVAGIKFHKITEETKSEVARLISALDDMPDEPAPACKDSADEAANEKDEKPGVSDVAGETDELAPDMSGIINKDMYSGETVPAENNDKRIKPARISEFQVEEVKDKGSQGDTVQATGDDIAAAGKGQKKKSRLYVPILMIIVIIFMFALPAALKKFDNGLESFTAPPFSQDIDKKHPVFAAGDAQTGVQTLKEPLEQLQEQPDEEKESTLTEQEGIVNSGQSSAKQDTAGDMTSDTPLNPGLKSEATPLGLAAVEIKETKEPEPGTKKEKIPKKSGPVVRHEKASGNKAIKKTAKPKKPERAVGAKKTVKAKARAKSKKAVEIETAAKNKKSPETKPAEKIGQAQKPEQVVRVGKIPGAGFTAKPEAPLKTIPAEAREKPEKTVPVVKPPKFPKLALIVRHKKPHKIQDGSISGKSKFANAVLSVKWKKIGGAKNRTPLFIDTETISYPSEHIVNFSIKASVNKKEFIELLEIDCSQIKLRIMEEPLEKIPVLTPYSTEWRDIIPESMLLYEAVCSKRNGR